MKKQKAGGRNIVLAEIIGQPPEQAINFSLNGVNFALVKLDHTADKQFCQSLGRRLMNAAGFKMKRLWLMSR